MNDTTIVKDVVQDNVVVARVFWEARVERIIQDYDYGRIDTPQLIQYLGNMGYPADTVQALLDQDYGH